MVREIGRECFRRTYGGSHGGGWIGKISKLMYIRVKVLWRVGKKCFNLFMCSGDLRGMIVNMLTCY